MIANEGQEKVASRRGGLSRSPSLIESIYRGQGQGTQVGCACLAYEAEVKSLSHAVKQENATLMNNATGNKGLDVPYAVIHEPLRIVLPAHAGFNGSSGLQRKTPCVREFAHKREGWSPKNEQIVSYRVYKICYMKNIRLDKK